ncbi:histone-fold-containing protein [Tricharina praecox]|uniref:histone-fold-containing protein n=1 Tax=Tricharina praecox TaxID=43433 RepID=UPI00221FFC53|nr:histone-fold-containing protein [Tricharina praecox]KAI5855777.1 histone-fold-containing protein [Tricharina praecox]
MPRKAPTTTGGSPTAAAAAAATAPSSSSAPSKLPKKKAPVKKKPEVTSIDDLALPRSIITRLAKSVLPANAAIQKQAVGAISQSSTVFVNFLCATANDLAHREGRKGLNAADILTAMKLLEFDDFSPRMEAELELFLQAEAAKKVPKEKENEKEKDETIGEATQELDETEEGEATPATKKARVDGSGDLEGSRTQDKPDSESEDDDDDDDVDVEASDDDAVVSDDEPEDEIEAHGDTDKEELDDRDTVGGEDVDDALDDGALSD